MGSWPTCIESGAEPVIEECSPLADLNWLISSNESGKADDRGSFVVPSFWTGVELSCEVLNFWNTEIIHISRRRRRRRKANRSIKEDYICKCTIVKQLILTSCSLAELCRWWLSVKAGILFFVETSINLVRRCILLIRAAFASSSSSRRDCIFTWPSSN